MLRRFAIRKRPYKLAGCIDKDILHDNVGGVDADRGVFMSKSSDSVATGVKDVSHSDSGFDEKCGVGWGKLSGLLPAL